MDMHKAEPRIDWSDLPRVSYRGGLTGYCCGQGPDLVLIHGVGLRAEAWAGVVPYLEDHFTLHLIDLPGHGQSPRAASRDLSAFAAPFEPMLASRTGAACIAGHSMGARIAMELATNNPSKIGAIAALSAVFRRGPGAARAVQSRAAALDEGAISGIEVTLRRWFGDTPDVDAISAATACARWLKTTEAAGYGDAYHVFAHDDGPTDGQLRSIGLPSLFLTGSGDPNSTPAMSHSLAAVAPNSTAMVVSGAAHMMPMTHATDVGGHLREFFLSGATT